VSILFRTTKHLFAEVGGTMLEYHKTTEAEKYIISDWKYEGEYALYNKAQGMKQAIVELLNLNHGGLVLLEYGF